MLEVRARSSQQDDDDDLDMSDMTMGDDLDMSDLTMDDVPEKAGTDQN
jgi:hypothetical protein